MRINRVQLNKDLRAGIYIAPEPSGSVMIFLSGLPSYVHRNMISEQLALQGISVIQPFYYGSWVSGGDFSPMNALQTVTDTIDSLVKRKIKDLYTGQSLSFPVEKIYLCGTSFGSSVVQVYKDERIEKKKYMISAIPEFSPENNKITGFDGSETIKFIQNGFPYVYRSNDWSSWQDAFSGKSQVFRSLDHDSIYVSFQGEFDSSFSPEILQNYYETRNLQVKQHVMKDAKHSPETMDPSFLSCTIFEAMKS